MYIPRLFKNDDGEAIQQFIQENGFGIIVSHSDHGILATHIPMELEEEKDEFFLRGHVAKGNPQWKHFENEQEVLAIFQGVHTYISSSWYNHINVPTWNYLAVHVYGNIRLLNDSELYQSVKRLVDNYEQDSSKPFTVESMPEDDLKKQMRGIVGFEIKITKIEGKKKLSQNRNDEDYQNVISELEKRNDSHSHQIAKEMRKLR